jgi:hypothetical protein
MKIVRGGARPAASGSPRGSIQAPMDRPADAFQPVAVDQQLIQEWMARRGDAGDGSRPAPPHGAPANEVDTGNSRWAATNKIEKIDRSALPSSLAPKAAAEDGATPTIDDAPPETSRTEERTARGRSLWVPVIVTVAVGLVIGLLVIKFFLLPSVIPSGAPPASTAPVGPAVVPRGAEPGALPSPVPAGPSSVSSPGKEEPAPGSTVTEDPASPVPTASVQVSPPAGAPPAPPNVAPPQVSPSPFSPSPRPALTARPSASPAPSPPPVSTQAPQTPPSGDKPPTVLF